MASKFQNRLVGTIILVALSIIILPGLLNGKKKNYQGEFAAIPLVSKPGDSDALDATLLAGQQLPNVPPKGAWEAVEQSSRPANSGQPIAELPDVANGSRQLAMLTLPEMKTMLPAPVKPESKPQASKGQAWVVQLGALKNADKVLEIVTKLQLSGYRVYTSPSVPVQGQITRIFVGPDVSKEKLQSVLGELNQLSNLNGQLRPCSITLDFCRS